MNKKRQPTSCGCFLCGKDNPLGLKVVWFNNNENNTVEAEVTVSENYRSYPGVVHGGIVAALLDETSGRAIMLNGDFDNLMVTLKLEVVYKKVTPTNTPLKLVGRVLRGGTSKAIVEAEILLPSGEVSAKGTALLYQMPADVKANWAEEADEWERTKHL